MTDGVDHMVRNRHLVESLERSLRSGKHGLSVVPGLVKQILREESWREFTTQRDELVRHDRFADFVAAAPLKGLGATLDLIERIVASDLEAVELLRAALKEKPGPKSRDVITRTLTGTSKSYALQRLQRDAPGLHAQVLAGTLSAHAAMVQAGFRPPTFTVRADSADSVAAVLRRQLDPATLAEVGRLLAL